MKIKQLFDFALKLGMVADPRGLKRVKTYLADAKKEYDDLRPKDKPYFYQDRLTNPYSDTGITVDDGKTEVKRILTGIDIDAGEILLASQLNERGKKIDVVLAHHPIGHTMADLHGNMDMLVDIYADLGVPMHVAEKLMEDRAKEVGRNILPGNHYGLVDMAKLLKVNLINIHTPADNLVMKFLENFIAKRKPRTVGDLMDLLLEIPEYQEAKKLGMGPAIHAGSPKHRLGKWTVQMTGGTNPNDKIYKELSRYGISTIIDMHIREGAREIATENRMNVVIAGHISSDSLGMNLLLDELDKKGIEIIPCGGLIRVSRNKKKNKK